jgi:hypothetical protein
MFISTIGVGLKLLRVKFLSTKWFLYEFIFGYIYISFVFLERNANEHKDEV